jgi:hypothetical protein
MLANSRGNAMIEILPVIAIFILLVNFSLGFFGVIHSGILGSISARNYAFETFRNRADLRYFRDIPGGDKDFTYAKSELRFHGVQGEKAGGNSGADWYATRREIKFSDIKGIVNPLGSEPDHTTLKQIRPYEVVGSNADEGVSPAWVRTAYGICLESKCGK